MEGPLSKWTNYVNGWQYRWFVLDNNSGLISYYTSKDKMKKGSRRGCFSLKGAIIGIDDQDDSTFTIRVQDRTFHFQAQDKEERERWVEALELCVKKLHQPIRRMELSLPGGGRPGLGLEQRMKETEAYYHILEEQVQTVMAMANATDEAQQLRQTAKTLLESLRQCIDMVKKTAENADNTSSQGSTGAVREDEDEEEEEEKEDVRPKGEVKQQESQKNVAPPVTQAPLVQVAAQVEEGAGHKAQGDDATGQSFHSGSSDESSDEFFDADTVLDPPPFLTSPSVSVPAAEGDPDDVEEDDELQEQDDTSGGVAANKSVIMHMLSQVRVGVDLTKIVLPTFILEKRSLLEMYAEFFAHPDVFASIADNSDPRDRMVAIVRYYLSAFHSARKGAIAKKPYNPILGEVFRCYWDLPNQDTAQVQGAGKKVVEKGPVPYARYNSVTFLAEQVSHHPPVSGFYAECPSKRMYVNGSFWTKSKFLGLSLGVNFIGSVKLHLLDYDEVYEANLPSAYARSILTVPWMEMGGKCLISCAKTGYSADIDFQCKPFYGGKKHQVVALLSHVSEKKPFMKVEGEWNGVMYMEHPNGDKEVFVDTLTLPTIRKKKKKLDAQSDEESQVIWRGVTSALHNRDIQAATAAKHAVEDQQRAEARKRQETGEEWKQRYFELEGEEWVFKNPLNARLAEV
ncbi:hypothetical protein EMCRGX_G019998 [Ephydatia muelleri]|eukprot:Em0011g20a